MESLILIILVIMPGVWSGNWKVTYTDQCTLKGTSVVIKCEYDYPFGHIVTSVAWSKALFFSGKWRQVYLTGLPSPPDHFKYVGNTWGDCSLRINDVQHNDEGRYFFHFATTLDRWRSKTSARLSVRELTTVVQPSTVTEGDKVSLTCLSGCPTPVNIVWFRDGQHVPNPVFQAGREDAGRYHCAVQGQEAASSASVALNVQYAPSNVTLSMSPSVVKGSSVTFTCSSDANPPVTQSGYRLYKDRHFISSGQNHTISDIQPSHSGLYYCQAWNNISRRGTSLINSTEVHLDVQYRPENITISMDLPYVVEGSSVNLTCHSAANPATDNYTWYRSTASSSSSMVYVSSGQVLSLPSVEAPHTGLYLCQARNTVGENNSTEWLLAMEEKTHGSRSLAVVAGIGVSVLLTLVLALLLLWLKQRTHAEKKQPVYDFRLSGRGSSSSASEDLSNSIYANIHVSPSSPPVIAVPDITLHSQRKSRHGHDASSAYEDEVTYSTVTITPRNPHRTYNSRSAHDSRSKSGENDSSVIYASLA
ncbi:B-cell receptor CD22-like isoform X1 [Epinephelus fuscoguttatus]|uniref:B-cell receptor CD22-like isoform X1 n=1 Tax=Epinephelus fuscoguttatus TaxID=293821 RepID=UPI0020D0012C|nr:B-cell receptor CD22-like isoform X1 [Epinephelus fuscoguttatus]